MKAMDVMRINNTPLLKYSKDYEEFIIKCNINEIEDFSILDNDVIDGLNTQFKVNSTEHQVLSMGAGSQVISSLSQVREELDFTTYSSENDSDKSVNQTNRNKSMYSELYPFFEDLVKQIKKPEQLKEAMESMEKLSFKFTNVNMNHRTITEQETTFLGEQRGSRRPEKRHRYVYER